MDIFPDFMLGQGVGSGGTTVTSGGGGSTGMIYRPKPIRIILKSFDEIRKKKNVSIGIKTDLESIDD